MTLRRRHAPLAVVLLALLSSWPWVRPAADQHEPWLLAAIETELGPRFSAALAGASRQASRGVPVLGVWSAPDDDCRSEMLVIAPTERADALQEWRRVAPGGTMAPVRIGRWQADQPYLTLTIGLVADPSGVDTRNGQPGGGFAPLERAGVARDPLWRMLPVSVQERWAVVEAGAEHLLLRAADGAERLFARCRVVVFRTDGRPALPVIP